MKTASILVRLSNLLLIDKISLLLFVLTFSSCAYYSPVYWGWGEWPGPEISGIENDSVAIFDWSKLPGIITFIDGDSVGSGYKKAKLLPGSHEFEYAYHPAEFGMHQEGLIEMDLKAGHEYWFRIKLCYSCIPRRYTTWVHDKTTGAIVWGKSKKGQPL